MPARDRSMRFATLFGPLSRVILTLSIEREGPPHMVTRALGLTLSFCIVESIVIAPHCLDKPA